MPPSEEPRRVRGWPLARAVLAPAPTSCSSDITTPSLLTLHTGKRQTDSAFNKQRLASSAFEHPCLPSVNESGRGSSRVLLQENDSQRRVVTQ